MTPPREPKPAIEVKCKDCGVPITVNHYALQHEVVWRCDDCAQVRDAERRLDDPKTRTTEPLELDIKDHAGFDALKKRGWNIKR